MASIQIGNSNLNDCKYGNIQINSIYKGNAELWSKTPSINLVAPMSNTSFWTEGLYDKYNTLTVNSNYVYSPLISIDASTKYIWRWDNSQLDSTYCYVCFLAYDTNSQFLSGAEASSSPAFGAMRDGSGIQTSTWSLPSGASYLRICVKKCDYFLFADFDNVNMFLPFTDSSWAQDKYLDSSGTLQTGTNYATSDYIPIPDGVGDLMWAYYDPNPTNEHWSAFILYNANKTRIDSSRPTVVSSNWMAVTTPVPGYTPVYRTIPSDAKYIRISIAKCSYVCCLTDEQY